MHITLPAAYDVEGLAWGESNDTCTVEETAHDLPAVHFACHRALFF